MLAKAPAVATTVTEAKPEMLPLVALIVWENAPADAPATNRPELLLILPPPFTTDQVGAGEMGTTTPLASWPDAVNCWVALTTMLAGLGVIVMLANGPGAAITTATEAKPETLPLVARIVLENDPADAPAVNRPELLLILPPPFTTDQMGAGEMGITTPFASWPDAVNC